MSTKSDFQVYGIFGHPLGHTLSPAMQEAGFKAIGRKAFYGVFDLERLRFARLMRRLPHLVLDGFNVTVPYKEDAARVFKGRVEPEARAVGAVNTVFKKRGCWRGTNTDVDGFTRALEKEGRYKIRRTKALVMGAGGAARAAVYALARQGAAQIVIVNRHEARGIVLARQFCRLFPQAGIVAVKLDEAAVKAALVSADLVVNATSVGLKAREPSLIPLSWIPRARGAKKKLFFDLIYRPAATQFLKNARDRGHRTLGGLTMLLYQGMRAFELWTGRSAPEAVMKRALLKGLRGKGL